MKIIRIKPIHILPLIPYFLILSCNLFDSDKNKEYRKFISLELGNKWEYIVANEWKGRLPVLDSSYLTVNLLSKSLIYTDSVYIFEFIDSCFFKSGAGGNVPRPVSIDTINFPLGSGVKYLYQDIYFNSTIDLDTSIVITDTSGYLVDFKLISKININSEIKYIFKYSPSLGGQYGTSWYAENLGLIQAKILLMGATSVFNYLDLKLVKFNNTNISFDSVKN